MKMKQIRIGGVFMSAKNYADEANQTIGAPLVPNLETVLMNRRNVTNRLSKTGLEAKEKIIKFFKKEYGLEVELVWDIHAGCTMCPCSPGYKIMVKFNRDYERYSRLREQDKFKIFVGGRGGLKIEKPSATWELEAIIKHYKESKKAG